MVDMFNVQTAAENGNNITLIYVMLMSFTLSTTLAFVYLKTFRGLSYSRNYVQAIILISIIAAMVIQSVGDSLARGIGIMAAMAIIRFRTNFKDPRDTLFIFAGLASGIACGAFAFNVAIIGTACFSIAALALHYSPVGPNSYFDGMLRFNATSDGSEDKELEKIIRSFCRSFALVTLREIEQGNRVDYAYHIKLRRNKRHEDLVSALSASKRISGVNLMMQEATVDI